MCVASGKSKHRLYLNDLKNIIISIKKFKSRKELAAFPLKALLAEVPKAGLANNC